MPHPMQQSYTVLLHPVPGAGQSEETLTVTHADGRQETMRLHEYDRIYRIPGLYELVVQILLQCQSPRVLAQSLAKVVRGSKLRVLDLGAGVGVVGEELLRVGVATLIGSDCSLEARKAAYRDRPGLYASYVIDDGSDGAVEALCHAVQRRRLNTLVCAGAIDDEHIPLERLAAIWSNFPSGSWIALAGSAASFRNMEPHEVLGLLGLGTVLASADTFRHRMRMDGTPIDDHHVIVGHRP